MYERPGTSRPMVPFLIIQSIGVFANANCEFDPWIYLHLCLVLRVPDD